MDNKEIGAILKKAREDAGYSRETIAEIIGKSVKTIGHYETGYTSIDVSTFFELCEIYNLNVDVAFGFKREIAYTHPRYALIAALLDLDDKDWATLVKIFTLINDTLHKRE